MPRFNPNKWTTADDTSPGWKTFDPPRVVLQLAFQGDRMSCPCGCGEFPEGEKATFKMGHDARLRGKLIRAHLMNRQIRFVQRGTSGEGPELVQNAVDVAEKYGWEKDIEAAELRREGTNRQVLRAALNSKRAIKIGRWDYTGQVAAVYPTATGDFFLIKYVDRAGNAKEIRVPASDAPLA